MIARLCLLAALSISALSLTACTDKGGDGPERPDDTGTATVDPTDADGDGFPAAWAGGTDCDDDDASVNPLAAEIWYDGIDQDCDGASDYDADGDGSDSDAYGGQDCDDGEFWVGPDALEVCTDGRDDDCDGAVDEAPCGWTTGYTDGLWYDTELQYLGTALAADCDLDGDGSLSVLVSAPGDPGELLGDETADKWDKTRKGVLQGGVYTAADSSGLFPKGGITVTRDGSPAAFGTGLDCAGDLNGDGYDDLAISSFDDGDEDMLGRTVVMFGPLSGAVDADLADMEWIGVVGEDYHENIGAVVRVADVTGDGVADVSVGIGDSYSPWDGASWDTIEAGSTMVFRGPFEDSSQSGWADAVELAGDLQGEMAIGDLDGDGVNDVVRNYPAADDELERCGGVYSGVDISAAGTSDGLNPTDGALAILDCPAESWPTSYVWKLRADHDLDQDGHADLFLAHNRGWSAFQGGADVWTGRVEATSRLEASFCTTGLGVRDVDFTRDEDDLLTWAVSLDGSPDCPSYVDTPFRGRVAIFEAWGWTDLVFDDAVSWVAWDEDSYGLDPQRIGSREVAFSHEDGTRLWFADPTWTRGDGAHGRLSVFDMDTLR